MRWAPESGASPSFQCSVNTATTWPEAVAHPSTFCARGTEAGCSSLPAPHRPSHPTATLWGRHSQGGLGGGVLPGNRGPVAAGVALQGQETPATPRRSPLRPSNKRGPDSHDPCPQLSRLQRGSRGQVVGVDIWETGLGCPGSMARALPMPPGPRPASLIGVWRGGAGALDALQAPRPTLCPSVGQVPFKGPAAQPMGVRCCLMSDDDEGHWGPRAGEPGARGRGLLDAYTPPARLDLRGEAGVRVRSSLDADPALGPHVSKPSVSWPDHRANHWGRGRLPRSGARP